MNAQLLDEKTENLPYQTEGSRKIRDMEFAGILHEQGLGKTKVGLGVALYWLRTGKVSNVLVITKKNIIKTWEDEIKKHTWLESYVIGRNLTETSYALTGQGKIFITNYDQVIGYEDTIKTWQEARKLGVILDESHTIKNTDICRAPAGALQISFGPELCRYHDGYHIGEPSIRRMESNKIPGWW